MNTDLHSLREEQEEAIETDSCEFEAFEAADAGIPWCQFLQARSEMSKLFLSYLAAVEIWNNDIVQRGIQPA